MALSSEIIAVCIMVAGMIAAYIAYEVYRWLQKMAETTTSKLDDILLVAFGSPSLS